VLLATALGGGGARCQRLFAATRGLETLLLLLRFHGIAVDAAQITHRFAGAAIKIAEMLRCAKELKLKVRSIATDWTHLKKLQLPAFAERKDGAFIILGKLVEESVLLLTRRASLDDLARRFDITWFY
jgi:ATP-binding cassette, subfamily B, bacterial HlyB/CyaB